MLGGKSSQQILLGSLPAVTEIQLGKCLQILIVQGPNHSDSAGLHCWIQREAGDGLLELPVDEERGHSSVGKRRRSVIV